MTSKLSLLSVFLLLLFSSCSTLQAQKSKKSKTDKPTEGAVRLANSETREVLQNQSLFNGLEFRNVGPTVMSGRVVDMAINPQDPTQFYVAYASGGLWVTRNNGTTFTPVFDSEIVLTLGAVSVDWKNGETIWVGTGEVNSSRSSYAGTGVYKSENLGESWQYCGLPESHHIGRIILHPNEPKTAWVAVLGHLYTPNSERGVYKTSDGGISWSHVLSIGENTGVVDLVIDPANPDHLFASAWHRTRRAWNFEEGGDESGVYESINGGSTWQLITGDGRNFPKSSGTGRIGLSVYNGSEGLHLYAILDNQDEALEKEKDDKDGLEKLDFESMSVGDFNALANTDLQEFLEENGFPEKYDSTAVRNLVKDGTISPKALFEYLTDANADLFNRPIIGAEVYLWDENNKAWKRTHDAPLDDVVYSYGYYFGVISVSPIDPQTLYIAGVPMLKSEDGGATWHGVNADNVHVDHHLIWLSAEKKGHLINGNDGGVNISYDGGENYIKCNSPAVGQFYTVNVDNADPYNVYGGLQDNGVWIGPSTYEGGTGWHQSGDYDYESLMGGDGMKVEIDTRDNSTIYTGYQFGHYYRIVGDDYHYFHPSHDLGERPLRWNWQTPVLLSHHNQDIVYMGSNRFHRSMDQGETWKTLSGDLTKGGQPGDVPFGSITTIDESPFQFGLIYLGTDDGAMHRSQDGGLTWTSIYGKLKPNRWVTRVVASVHDENRVYCTLNGYRNDDFTAYAYKSDDRGNTWTSIGASLPLEPVNVILEDPENENILFVGTDNGVYMSTDMGITFSTIGTNLPPVAVHDMVIQEREADLILGTHGRSIYIADLEPIRTTLENESALIVFDIASERRSNSWGSLGGNVWFERTEPSLEIPYFNRRENDVSFTLESDSGLVLHEWAAEQVHQGYNITTYNFTIDEDVATALAEELNGDENREEKIENKAAENGKFYLPAAHYVIRAKSGDLEVETTFELE